MFEPCCLHRLTGPFITSEIAERGTSGCRAERTWQARRESNPQPPVLETGALPIELLACTMRARGDRPGSPCIYFDSRCTVCVRHHRQYFLNSNLPVVFRLFLVVL